MTKNETKVGRWLFAALLALAISGLTSLCAQAAPQQAENPKDVTESKSGKAANAKGVLVATPEAGGPARAAKPAPGSGSSSTDWGGGYVGFYTGGAKGGGDTTTSTVFSPTGYFAASSVPAIAATGVQHPDTLGITGGFQGGYNFQFNNLVVGFEAEFGAYHTAGSKHATTAYPCCAPTGFTVRQTLQSEWLFTARPRLGGVVHHNTLIYLTGGVAITDSTYKGLFTDTFATAHENAEIDGTLTGWTVGGGAEFRLQDHLSFKVEYLYLSLGDPGAVTSTNLTAFTPPISFPSNVFTHTASGVNGHTVRIGFNHRF